MAKRLRRNLKDQLKQLDVKYCFNKQRYNLEKLKFIIVGDNPGIKEFQEKRYFIGPSGKALKNHFQNYELANDFYKECIIFNKTFIHTRTTKALDSIKTKIGETLFDSTQKYCATEICTLSNRLNLPILIFGKSNIGQNKLFEKFWNVLNKEIKNPKNIFVFNHPAYGNFKREWNKYHNTKKSNIELLKYIGTLNYDKIKC